MASRAEIIMPSLTHTAKRPRLLERTTTWVSLGALACLLLLWVSHDAVSEFAARTALPYEHLRRPAWEMLARVVPMYLPPDGSDISLGEPRALSNLRDLPGFPSRRPERRVEPERYAWKVRFWFKRNWSQRDILSTRRGWVGSVGGRIHLSQCTAPVSSVPRLWSYSSKLPIEDHDDNGQVEIVLGWTLRLADGQTIERLAYLSLDRHRHRLHWACDVLYPISFGIDCCMMSDAGGPRLLLSATDPRRPRCSELLLYHPAKHKLVRPSPADHDSLGLTLRVWQAPTAEGLSFPAGNALDDVLDEVLPPLSVWLEGGE